MPRQAGHRSRREPVDGVVRMSNGYPRSVTVDTEPTLRSGDTARGVNGQLQAAVS